MAAARRSAEKARATRRKSREMPGYPRERPGKRFSAVRYAPNGTATRAEGIIVWPNDGSEALVFEHPANLSHWYVRLASEGPTHWAHIDSDAGKALTRENVNEVARETVPSQPSDKERTITICFEMTVTTRAADLNKVVELVHDSLCAGGRPMEFCDGDISAEGTDFTILDWDEVRK